MREKLFVARQWLWRRGVRFILAGLAVGARVLEVEVWSPIHCVRRELLERFT